MRYSNYYYGYLVDLTGDAYAIVFRIVYGIEQQRNLPLKALLFFCGAIINIFFILRKTMNLLFSTTIFLTQMEQENLQRLESLQELK